jgi:DNA-binding transcriptional MerR regulator
VVASGALHPSRTARAVAGISARQLDYWVERGLIRPQRSRGKGRRLFTFRDLIVLRTIAELRTCGVGLDEIRLLADQLAADDADLASELIVAAGGQVYRLTDSGDLTAGGRLAGQLAFTVVVLDELRDDVAGRLRDLEGEIGVTSPVSEESSSVA